MLKYKNIQTFTVHPVREHLHTMFPRNAVKQVKAEMRVC